MKEMGVISAMVSNMPQARSDEVLGVVGAISIARMSLRDGDDFRAIETPWSVLARPEPKREKTRCKVKDLIRV